MKSHGLLTTVLALFLLFSFLFFFFSFLFFSLRPYVLASLCPPPFLFIFSFPPFSFPSLSSTGAYQLPCLPRWYNHHARTNYTVVEPRVAIAFALAIHSATSPLALMHQIWTRGRANPRYKIHGGWNLSTSRSHRALPAIQSATRRDPSCLRSTWRGHVPLFLTILPNSSQLGVAINLAQTKRQSSKFF